MDSDINRWILEFLLMSSAPDSTTKHILKALPLPETDNHLAKMIALKSMQSELSAASITETSLECLVIIEEINTLHGISVTQSMKEAFCAVAVECVVKHIDSSPDKNRFGLFNDSYNRILRDKLLKMITAISLGTRCQLFSVELVRWKDEIVSAFWDVNMCERLMKMNTRQIALDKVEIFLKETWASIGPSFLEVAEASKDMLVHEMSVPGGNEGGEELVNRVVPSVGEDEAMNGTELTQKIDKAIQKGKRPLEHNHAVPSRRTRRGVKMSDSEEVGPATVCSKDQNKSNTQVEQSQKSKKSLRSSSLESQELVKDTLPGALHESDIVGTELVTKGINHEPAIENQSTLINVPEQSTCQSTVPNQPIDDSSNKQSSDICSNGRRPNTRWMVRNSTAQTHERDVPFDDLPGGSSNKRRRKVQWSPEEVDALRDGIEKFGRGKWKQILRYHVELFEKSGRTEVDLKDKWRNLSR